MRKDVALFLVCALLAGIAHSAEIPEKILKRLDMFITEAAKSESFSGVVLLARNGKPFFKKAYGFASRRFWIPNRIDTKFNLGSMNKMFTTVAIAQLVERGMLSYTDAIGQHLDEGWIKPEIGKRITIHHLLNHTSGLGDFFSPVFFDSSKLRFRSVNDYQVLVRDMNPGFEPGSKWSYSNAGFILLGAIVERLSGMDYFEYVLENVHQKAGMINTDCYEMDRPIPNLAIGYEKREREDGSPYWQNNLYLHEMKGAPAGGGFSTAEDLLNFDIALRDGTLVLPETWKLLITERARPSEGSKVWGYGFIIENHRTLGRIVGHGGGFFGISSNLDMYLDNGFTTIVLSNYGGGCEIVADEIREVIQDMIKERSGETDEGRLN